MKRLIAILMSVLATTVSVGSVQADHYFCAGTDNTWNDGSNWKSASDCAGADSGVPTAADRVIVLSGKTCNVDITTAVADSVNVESTATLNIETGMKLTIDDTAGSNTTIAGTLNLQGSGSELAFTTNNQTIDGAGKIVGQHNSALITIEALKTLTNDTTIEGQLTITDDSISGTFVNSGTVHADVAGTLLISTDSFDDNAGALWKVSKNSSAILKFGASGTKALLEGDFAIFDDAKLVVGSPGFETTGSLVWEGGTIDVASSSLADFGLPDPV